MKLDGIVMTQENHAKAIAEDKARAYRRACRIKKAKQKAATELIVGIVVGFLIICAYVPVINILSNLLRIVF